MMQGGIGEPTVPATLCFADGRAKRTVTVLGMQAAKAIDTIGIPLPFTYT